VVCPHSARDSINLQLIAILEVIRADLLGVQAGVIAISTSIACVGVSACCRADAFPGIALPRCPTRCARLVVTWAVGPRAWIGCVLDGTAACGAWPGVRAAINADVKGKLISATLISTSWGVV